MADNYSETTTQETVVSTTFASDNISDVHHPKFKMEFGDNNTATEVSETNPLPSKEGFQPAYEDNVKGVAKVEERYLYQTITTATTTTISGATYLKGIRATGGTAGTIVIYDNTAASGTKVADYDSTNSVNHDYHTTLGTGLTVVTGAATKLTILYRV